MLMQTHTEPGRTRFHLKVRGVSVSIGRHRIVEDVSFQAEPGPLHAIIGPSGSGKTTLLKAITGELACSGAITLSGHDVGTSAPERQARLRGVLPQASRIAFPLSVAEVVGLGIIDRAHGRHARFARIGEALEMVGLGGFEGLSGGEQQRVQFARVLCQVWEPVSASGLPRWLFLDEPVSSLDIKHQIQIMQLAADYAQRGGGVVAVMHDLNLTAAFADHVLVMKNGRLIGDGRAGSILQPDLLSETFGIPLAVNRLEDGRNYIAPEFQA